MAIDKIPQGYAAVTPYLIFRDAAKAIDFYTRAFDATESMRFEMPGGGVGHAEIRIGGAAIMLADEMPEMDCNSVEGYQGSPAQLFLYVEDCDAVFAQALAAGAEERRPVADQFYGDRVGMIRDPFGFIWTIATHIEDVSEEEMRRRIANMPEQTEGG